MKFITFFIATIVLGSCHSQPASLKLKKNSNDNSLLWEVSGNGLSSPSFLFGTFHLMCKEDINFSGPVVAAIKSSDKVYMELKLDDPSMMQGGILLMNMKEGKQLKDLYTITEYNRLSKFFKDSIGMSLSIFQGMKPYFLEALIYPKMMPCKSMSGIEEELIKISKLYKKEIRGLETVEFQAAVFDSIPYQQQARELLKSIDSLQDFKTALETMLTAYKGQQLDEIEKLLNKSEFGMQENKDLLLDKRNKKWVSELKNIMIKEPVFVAVGAGHLVGKTGLIALLVKEGYTLRPLSNK